MSLTDNEKKVILEIRDILENDNIKVNIESENGIIKVDISKNNFNNICEKNNWKHVNDVELSFVNINDVDFKVIEEKDLIILEIVPMII